MAGKTGRRAAELCGAVIGAGFASGREIHAFFSRFGVWSWLGVAAAAAVMGWMGLELMRNPGDAGMPPAWRGHWLNRVWKGMFIALMTATGGAMLAAGGEVAALMLPMHGARGIGLALMLAAAWFLARRDTKALSIVSRGLILCFAAVVATGLFSPAEEVVSMRQAGGASGIVYGLCYGGFNIALAAPVVTKGGKGLTDVEKKRCTLCFVAVAALLLACGNGVLLRHGMLQRSYLPFVMLLSPLGYAGYLLGGVTLGLASLTTLVASLRGLFSLSGGRMLWPAAVMLALAASRLESIVGVVYPILGGGCFLLLCGAIVQNRTKM